MLLSVLLTWVLIGLVMASIGSRIVDATGACLLQDLGVGAAGATCGGIVLMCLEMSSANSMRPIGFAASLFGAIAAFVGWHVLVSARSRPAKSGEVSK
jgi:uncharacterized membrane protein YeaQ/YmgE (transglycosylase-associated protein family)